MSHSSKRLTTEVVPASSGVVSASRRSYILTAAVLLAVMAGGTLPVPLYVLYEQQMGFGPLGVTVVFAAYVVGTLSALVAFGDLSDHIGRRKLLAIAVGCAAVSTALFLVASGIGLLIVARIVSGLAAGFATGTATAALAELQPHGDRRAAAVWPPAATWPGLGSAAGGRDLRRVRGHADPQRVLGLPGRLRAGARRDRGHR